MTLTVAILAFGVASATASNYLVANPSFEAGLDGWQARVVAGQPDVRVTDDQAFDGTRSLLVTHCGKGAHVRIEQRLRQPLEPGAYYFVKVRYRFAKTSMSSIRYPARFSPRGPGDVEMEAKRSRRMVVPRTSEYAERKWLVADWARLMQVEFDHRGKRVKLGPRDLTGVIALEVGSLDSPDGWVRYDGIEVRKATVREIAADRGYFPAQPVMSDAEFFKAIDLDRPGLAATKRAVEQADWPAAKAAFLQHLRTRQRPVHFFTAGARKQWVAGLMARGAVTKSKRLLAGEMEAYRKWYKFDEPIDWLWRGIEGRGGMINRYLGGGHNLLAAYFATRERQYLERYVHLWLSWYRRARPPQRKPSTKYGGCVWQPLQVGIRLGERLRDYLFLLHDEVVSLDVHATFWKSFLEHGRYCTLWHEHYWGGNHQTHEMQRVFQFAVCFPEFREAEAWRDQAAARLKEHCVRDTLPDGAHNERNPSYNQGVLKNYLIPMCLARANDLPMPPEFESTVERTFEWFMYTLMPDGTMPPYGDAGYFAGGKGRIEMDLLTVGAMLYPGRSDFAWFAFRDPKARERVAAEFFGDEEGPRRAEALAAAKKTCPAKASVLLPDTGWAMMRSNWTTAALALNFDFGPFVAHCHKDCLAFNAVAWGEHLLHEGKASLKPYGYNAPWHLGWNMRTVAHNTIMIDGADQPETSGRLDQWATSPGFDYVRASFGPYRDCTHTRSILFVKPEYWVVSDDVAGRGRHEFRWLAHFLPNELLVDEGAGFAKTRYEHGVNALLAWADVGRVTIGQAMGYFAKPEPVTPFIWLERNAEPPVHYDVLLAPWKQGMPTPRNWQVTRTSDGLVAEIPRGEGRTDVYLRAHRDGARLDRYELAGRAALLRYDGSRWTSLFAVGCHRVAVRGQDVLRAEPAAAFVAAQRMEGELRIDCEGARTVWLAMPEPERCIVNGKPGEWGTSGGGVIISLAE